MPVRTRAVRDGTVVLGGKRSERAAVRVPAEGHALLDGEAGRSHIFGGDDGHRSRQPVAAPIAEQTPLHPDGAAHCRKKPGEGPEKRRLTSGIGSDDGERLAGPDH